MFLSKLGYSELVQRIFEKITFFRVDPLVPTGPPEGISGNLEVFSCNKAVLLLYL